MRIATFNVNGLASSEAAVHNAWKVLGLDILCLVETWLRPTDEVHIGLPHDVVSLEAPQKGRPHGGIVFLRRPGLQKRVLARYATKSYQILAIHVKPGLNVIGVYITPKTERIAIRECLARLKSLCRGPTVILGDWNARHLDWDDKSNKQGQLVRNWVLQWNLNLRAPATARTYLTPYGRSVVDFFVSRGVQIDEVTGGNGTWDSVSDHCLVSGVLQWSAAPADMQNKRISKAMLKNPRILQQAKKSYKEKLPALIREIDMISSNSELNDTCSRFADILKQPFESNRRPRPDRFRFFWYKHIDYLAKLRSKFYRKWRRRGDMELLQKYKDLDKLIKRTTRDKKRALLEEFSSPIQDEKPSLMAKRVNTLIKLRANRAATATERGNSLDSAAYTKYVQRAQPSGCGVFAQPFNVPGDFKHELVATVRSSRKQRATGPDGIANEMLQLCPELCGKVLYLLWKACGQLAYIPNLWSEGNLCPQHKKGSYDNPDNYRGLTLLSHARKTISATINRLVLRYVEFHKYQHWFTKYNGTEQAIIEVSDTITNSQKFIAVLDQMKAYDRVSRSLLFTVCQQTQI